MNFDHRSDRSDLDERILITNHDGAPHNHSQHDHDEQGDVALQIKFKRPPLYAVVIFNDDYTPMEFVIDVLNQFFNLDYAQATQVMLNVHHKGKGVAGIYPRDIAESKANLVNDYSREHGHPLLAQIEVVDDED